MQLRHFGLGLLVAVAVLFLAGGAAAHANDTDATTQPSGNGTADWAAWMDAHMGPGAVQWMESHMGVTIEEMGAYMDGNGGMGTYGGGPSGGGCH